MQKKTRTKSEKCVISSESSVSDEITNAQVTKRNNEPVQTDKTTTTTTAAEKSDDENKNMTENQFKVLRSMTSEIGLMLAERIFFFSRPFLHLAISIRIGNGN